MRGENSISDNRRRHRAIKDALRRLYPGEPKGNLARHLDILAALISGIVGSKRTNLPAIAQKIPDACKVESRIKRFYRWIINEKIDADLYFLPFIKVLLACLAQQTLVLVMDGSIVGQGCITLMVSLVYKQRALPIAWIVIKGGKGHFPEQTHVELLELVEALIPEGADVVFLGDGEFDGTSLQATLESYGWFYACRTAKNTVLFEDGEKFSFQDLDLYPGRPPLSLPNIYFTIQAYGPVHAVLWWKKGCKEPLYLITNFELADEACYWYKKRFKIETFFSDQKSRGFYLHKSHLSDPSRLSRLMIAACLAYIWIIFLGVKAKVEGWDKIIHRTDRCDLSLFQLGLRLLEHFLNEGLSIPVKFHLLI